MEVDEHAKIITIRDELHLRYDRLFNTAGLNADKVARKLGLNHNYVLIPFKGIYWELSKKVISKLELIFIQCQTLIYLFGDTLYAN